MDARTSIKSPSLNDVHALIRRNLDRFLFYMLHAALACIQEFTAIAQHVARSRLLFPVKNLSVSTILEDAQNLTKTPKHIAVIISEDEINIADVVNIIVWSFVIGIPCITVSDSKGFLDENSLKLQKEFEEKHKAICKDWNLACPSIKFHKGTHTRSLTGSYDVIISSIAQCRKHMIQCAKDLCVCIKDDVELKSKFNSNIFDNKIKEYTGNVSDPDLVISFGPYLSYFGFQPWNMRLTEMISLSTHHNLTYGKFLQALRKFARCDQRCGT